MEPSYHTIIWKVNTIIGEIPSYFVTIWGRFCRSYLGETANVGSRHGTGSSNRRPRAESRRRLLVAKPDHAGAGEIRGPKRCGQTETALQVANSAVMLQVLDTQANNLALAKTKPSVLPRGRPRTGARCLRSHRIGHTPHEVRSFGHRAFLFPRYAPDVPIRVARTPPAMCRYATCSTGLRTSQDIRGRTSRRSHTSCAGAADHGP